MPVVHSPAHELAPKYLSVGETARALGLGESTIWAMVRSGEIGSVFYRNRRLIPVTAIDAFMEAQSPGADVERAARGLAATVADPEVLRKVAAVLTHAADEAAARSTSKRARTRDEAPTTRPRTRKTTASATTSKAGHGR